VNPAPVNQIQFIKPSYKRDASEDVNDQPVRKIRNVLLIDPEDWYRSFYPIIPNASLFTIAPPPEESNAPTTSVANFVTSQSVVESNPATAGSELVEKTTKDVAEETAENVTEHTAEYDDVVLDVDPSELPLIMECHV